MYIYFTYEPDKAGALSKLAGIDDFNLLSSLHVKQHCIIHIEMQTLPFTNLYEYFIIKSLRMFIVM